MTVPVEGGDRAQVSGAAHEQSGQGGSVASVALLGAAAFAVTADTRVVTPLLPIIAHEFRTTIGATGALVTAYSLPYGLLQILHGPLGDRVGKLGVMVWAMGFFCVMCPT